MNTMYTLLNCLGFKPCYKWNTFNTEFSIKGKYSNEIMF